jgi:hypothetical protein
MTLLFFCVDAALFFNSYVNPVALSDLNWKYYIVYDVWLAVELTVVYFFFIETRNTPLEEIVKYFDGDAAILGGDLATEKSRHFLVEEGIGKTGDITQIEQVDGTLEADEKTTHHA